MSTTKIQGNHTPGMHSVGTGSGVGHRRAPFSQITVSGKSGETVRVSATDLYPKFDQVFQGINVQALTGSVEVYVTLAPIDLAMNPEQDVCGHWLLDTTAAPGAINKLTHLGTALKLVFLGDATIYLAGV